MWIRAACEADDGHIEAEVAEIRDAGLVCETVKTVKEKGVKVNGEGRQFPDLDIRLSVLTEKDYTDLKFAAAHADVIAFSFIKSAEDIATIEEARKRTDRREVGTASGREDRDCRSD